MCVWDVPLSHSLPGEWISVTLSRPTDPLSFSSDPDGGSFVFFQPLQAIVIGKLGYRNKIVLTKLVLDVFCLNTSCISTHSPYAIISTLSYCCPHAGTPLQRRHMSKHLPNVPRSQTPGPAQLFSP